MDNKQIILYIIKNNGLLLKFVNDKFKDDIEIVNIAIANNGNAIKFASSRLQNDYSICLSVIMNTYNHKLMKYMSSNLCDNYDFI